MPDGQEQQQFPFERASLGLERIEPLGVEGEQPNLATPEQISQRLAEQAIRFPEMQESFERLQKKRQLERVKPEVTRQDLFGPTPPAEPLQREDIFPGITEGLQVGTISTPSLGATPIFFGGGALFPFEFINSRRRALTAAAKKSEKDKAELLSLLTPPETAEQHQAGLNTRFFDYVNGVFDELRGNEEILNDPTNPFTRKVLQRFANFNTEARIGLRYNALATKALADDASGELTLTKANKDRAERWLTPDAFDKEKLSVDVDFNDFNAELSISGIIGTDYVQSIERGFIDKIEKFHIQGISEVDTIRIIRDEVLADIEGTSARVFSAFKDAWNANDIYTTDGVKEHLLDILPKKFKQSVQTIYKNRGGAGSQKLTDTVYNIAKKAATSEDIKKRHENIINNESLSKQTQQRRMMNAWSSAAGLSTDPNSRYYEAEFPLGDEDKVKDIETTLSDLALRRPNGKVVTAENLIAELSTKDEDSMTDEEYNLWLFRENLDEIADFTRTRQISTAGYRDQNGNWQLTGPLDEIENPGLIDRRTAIQIDELQPWEIKNIIAKRPGLRAFVNSMRGNKTLPKGMVRARELTTTSIVTYGTEIEGSRPELNGVLNSSNNVILLGGGGSLSIND